MRKHYRRIFYFFGVVSILVGIMCTSGCNKSAGPAPYNSLLQQISSDTNLIILNEALIRTHLDTVFEGGGPYTFFAPVDSAFIEAGLTLEQIDTFNVDSLRDILTYNIVIGKVSSATILGFVGQYFVSLNPQYQPYIVKNYFGIFINKIRVVEGNIYCADGVLQKIGQMDFPP